MMKKTLLSIALLASSLCGAMETDFYFSGSTGGAAHDLGKKIPAFSYRIQAARDTEVVQEGEEVPLWEEFTVNVSCRDLLGVRASGCFGSVLDSVYRIEAEYSYTCDQLRLTHRCRDLEMEDSHNIKRKSYSAMCNVGGYFPGWHGYQPYSMVGGGIESKTHLDQPRTTKFCYQWITGMEAPLSQRLNMYVQHRYRKTFRALSMHSVELGVKVSI